MCGLVGYVGPTPPVDRARLAHMRDTLAHRGPDDADLWTTTDDGCAVGLAHRRLAIVDLSVAGRQPMARDGLRVVFNGEIYSHRALRQRLEADGARFTTETDTEVLPALYRRHGLDMVDQLDGMFAFALWDAGQRRLLLARDRLGIKPLFYAHRADGTLLFASEIKALLASHAIDDTIDPQALHDYLGLNYVPGPRTMLRGIRQLPPGHALLWQDGAVRIWRWWQPDFTETPRPPRFSEAADRTRTLLIDAVQRRLMADVPVGMFLSGGIDSTAVLWALRALGVERPKAFTIRFAEASYDESPVAARVATALGAEHHVETVTPDLDTVLGPLTAAMDQPYADSSAIPLWYLCRLARRHVTVALGGDGGDEVFAGYRTHLAWRLAGWWRRLPSVVRDAWVPALVQRLPVSHAKVSFDLKARAFVDAASRPALEAHYRFKQFLTEDARRALTTAEEPVSPTVRLFERAAAAPTAGEGLHRVLAADLAVYLPDDILVKVDRISMLHGLEARVPFLDHTLVERVARWPAAYKLRGLVTKAALRRALAGRVPGEVLTRRKAGFNVPMARWLDGPLRPLVETLLAPSAVAQTGVWRPEAVQRLITEHRGRHRDHSRPLWAMLCFMLFERHHRRRAPAPGRVT